MFRVIGAILAIILAIVAGTQISALGAGGLLSFVGGIVAWVVFASILTTVGTLIDVAVKDSEYERMKKSYGRSGGDWNGAPTLKEKIAEIFHRKPYSPNAGKEPENFKDFLNGGRKKNN